MYPTKDGRHVMIDGGYPVLRSGLLDLPECSNSAKALASEGATPLHIYSPYRATMPPFDIDTGHGKLSAFLDIEQPPDQQKLLALVSEADVFAQSYRLGSVSAMFPPEKIAAVQPGIIYVSISCFGFDSPWQLQPGWAQLAHTNIVDSHRNDADATRAH
ncbi:MAG: hypothetical protein CK528_00975 [Alcaligenaceae bacterium]|nr:MAG: hypothetical protein CK528_00975 [Alcaligenaceae bacterium]